MNTSTENLMRGASLALDKGEYKQLQALCMQVLKFDTKIPDAWFYLGMAAGANNETGKAIEFIERALLIQPSSVEYLYQKAQFHAQLNQNEKALKSANAALQLEPNKAIEFDTLGAVYTKIGEYALAREAHARACEKEPESAQFQFNLAGIEQFLGNVCEARNAYQSAISLNPNFARAHWAFSELEGNQSDEARLRQLQELFEEPGLSTDDELYLGHALSTELESVGDYALAFATLQRAKARRGDAQHSSLDADRKLFQSLHESFPLDRSTPNIELSRGEKAIFVVGMPSSGASMIERILAGDSQVRSLGELPNFARSVKKESNTFSPLVLDDSVVRRAVIGSIENIGLRYLQSIESQLQDKKYFIDKTPLNFFNVGFIMNALPAAKIVCVRRHPLDACLGNFRQLLEHNSPYYDYHYSIEGTALYYVEFDRLMAHWQSLYPARFIQIQYEELTTNPEAQAKQLYSSFGFSWQPQCLDSFANKAAASTDDADQSRQLLCRKRIDQWKNFSEQLKPAIRILEEAGIAL